MVQLGSKRCHPSSLFVVIGLVATLAGCSTVVKTFDMTPDPELKRAGVYPNINVAGSTPPGKVLTPDEQKKVSASLNAQSAQANPGVGAAAQAEAEKSAKELNALAASHAQKTLSDIQNECDGKSATDATKCPQ